MNKKKIMSLILAIVLVSTTLVTSKVSAAPVSTNSTLAASSTTAQTTDIAGQCEINLDSQNQYYVGPFKAHRGSANIILQNYQGYSLDVYINGQKVNIPQYASRNDKNVTLNIGAYVVEGDNDIYLYNSSYSSVKVIIPYLKLKAGTPEEAGMLSQKLNDIDTYVNNAISTGITPGAAVLVAKGGIVVKKSSYGYAQKYDMGKLLQNPVPMMTNTMFDMASCTKVMATTQAIMQLASNGKIKVTDKVSKYIPEFAQNGKENITIADLLTHTSGLTAWKPTFYHASNADEELKYICSLPLEYKTGTDRKYSDFSFMTLAFVVKAVTGQQIDQYTHDNIYSKLNMNDTMFTPLKINPNLKSRIAATSWGNPFEYRMVAQPGWVYKLDEKVSDWNGWRKYTLVGEVNDGNSFYANNGIAGHAGLFSTVDDLAILGQAMLNGGGYDKVKLYDKSVLDQFTTPQKPVPNWTSYNYGYGWEIARSSYMGNFVSERSFGHSGFTGTQVIFDPKYDLQIIILTNKQNNGVNSKTQYASTFALSKDICNTVYQSIVKQ